MKKERIEELKNMIDSTNSDIRAEEYWLEYEGGNLLKSLIVPGITAASILGFIFLPAKSFLLTISACVALTNVLYGLAIDVCRLVEDKNYRYDYPGGGFFFSIFYLITSIFYVFKHSISLLRSFISKRKLKKELKELEKSNIEEEVVEDIQEDKKQSLNLEDEVLKDLYLITEKCNDLPSDLRSIFLKRIKDVFFEYKTKYENLYTSDSKGIKLSNISYRQLVIDTLKRIVDIEIDLDKAIKEAKELEIFNKEVEELNTYINTVEDGGCLKLEKKH